MEQNIETLRQDIIELDKADLIKLYNKEHEWHKLLVEQFNLPSVSELPSLPQPFMLGFDRAKLVYKEGEGKYGKGYAEAELDVSQNDPGSVPFPWRPCNARLNGARCFSAAHRHMVVFLSKHLWSCTGIGWELLLQRAGIPHQQENILPHGRAKAVEEKTFASFDGHLAVDTPDNIIYTFGISKVGFFTAEELKIPDVPVGQYYKPDWELLKYNAISWIENAERFYNKNARK